MIMIAILFAAFLALTQDAYLKHEYANKHPEVIGEYLDTMKK